MKFNLLMFFVWIGSATLFAIDFNLIDPSLISANANWIVFGLLLGTGMTFLNKFFFALFDKMIVPKGSEPSSEVVANK
ncbi:hypothetical protein [Cytobacillus gottheilii]|uniref:hypothetical protein n=1 Tax=Cytobacillus gottheilii TaxID=859144 RepID=UPI00083722E5|nr:hypothetical protein [Cytobacillus gottheilii]